MGLEPTNIEPVKDEKFVYLTTIGRRTAKPHVVELWFAFAAGKIYLSHEGEHTDWMKNLTKNSRVAVRIGSINFDAVAKLAEHGTSREEGKKALYVKYYGPALNEVIDDWFELSTVVELTPVK